MTAPDIDMFSFDGGWFLERVLNYHNVVVTVLYPLSDRTDDSCFFYQPKVFQMLYCEYSRVE